MLRLIGYLTAALEEAGRRKKANLLREFALQHREKLIVLEDAYTEGRYSLPSYTRSDAEKDINTAQRLPALLESIAEAGSSER